MSEEKLKDEAAVAVPPADVIPVDYADEQALSPFEGDFMDVTIQVADHLDKYEKAMNAIMNFIIKRTYPGDWVSHDKMSTPVEERTVNLTGAAAERIARDLGIQESKRTPPVKEILGDKHPGHYAYKCTGEFSLRGRTVLAIGYATTTNPLHSKKQPHQIPESYIIQEAHRDCTKQGVKMLLGLRKIPLSKLKELGFNIDNVKYVNFGEGENSASAKNPGATAKPREKETIQATFVIKVLSPRTWNDTNIIDIITDKNEKFSWFGKSLSSEEGKQLDMFRKNEYLVTVTYSTKGSFKNIESIVEGVPQ